LSEPWSQSVRVAVPMVPTLIFTLVLCGILRETYAIPSYIIGGLVVYTVLNTLVPGLVLGTPALVFDAPELPSSMAVDSPPGVPDGEHGHLEAGPPQAGGSRNGQLPRWTDDT
jgi:hypothetical protein